jgi:hypothetical protein
MKWDEGKDQVPSRLFFPLGRMKPQCSQVYTWQRKNKNLTAKRKICYFPLFSWIEEIDFGLGPRGVARTK